MDLSNLKLINFRNYKSLSINFSPEVNFITGYNGSGKTNIIESIALLSNLKSFKNISDSDLVNWTNSSYYCSGEVNNSDYKKFEIGFSFNNKSKIKKIKIDSNEIKKASDYYGKLLSVLFLPEDINIINGNPELKRRYFDSVISKIYPEYINELNYFKHILSSRNKLLKKIRESGLSLKNLEVWDRMFSEKYSSIYLKRKSFIDKFNKIFSNVYKLISNEDNIPFINYSSSIENSDVNNIYNSIVKKHSFDVHRGQCSIGPQKDLYNFLNEDKLDLKLFASQGQRRTAAISIKAAEFDIIEELSEKKSIILVDDIFSELDDNRRSNMISYLVKKGQLIFTMVNSNIIDLGNITNCKKFSVSNSNIIEEV